MINPHALTPFPRKALVKIILTSPHGGQCTLSTTPQFLPKSVFAHHRQSVPSKPIIVDGRTLRIPETPKPISLEIKRFFPVTV